jgi:hypothetical protein
MKSISEDKYNMKKKTRSLLEELESISQTHDTKHIIERRANNLIASAIHLMEVIERNFTPEQSAILEKKLLIAIKNRDQSKFSNSLKRASDEN